MHSEIIFDQKDLISCLQGQSICLEMNPIGISVAKNDHVCRRIDQTAQSLLEHLMIPHNSGEEATDLRTKSYVSVKSS